jgi:sterol desaturase/sphingolipid hydroxylase (fatty acid hydroxylase superfamily)
MRHLARAGAWLFVVTFSSAGFLLGFATGHVLLALALVPVAAWVVIVPLEAWLPALDQGSAWRDPQVRQDVFHTVVGQGFGNELGAAIVAGVAAVPLGWAGGRFGVALWPATWPLGIQVLLGIVVADGMEYARHRAEHG